MSSAFGTIDVNRIALNQAARQAQAIRIAQQQQEDQQRQEAAAKQAELEAKKAQEEQEKRDAEIRAANSRASSDPLIQQARTQAFLNESYKKGTLIKDLQSAGVDADYVTLSVDKNGNIDLGSLKGFQFEPNTNRGGQSSVSAPVVDEPPTPETPIFGSLTLSQAKAAFQNPTQLDKTGIKAGYAQLQSAEKQAGEYYTKPIFGSLTASQAANSLYIPNIRAKEAVMTANMKEAAITKRYEVKSNDSLSSGSKQYYYDPLNPFDITDKAPQSNANIATGMPKPTRDIFTEFGLGIRDVAEGYGSLLTGKEGPYNIAGEAQNALFRESAYARSKGIMGFDVNVEAFPKIAGEAAKNPARAVGQVYGEVIFGLLGSEGLSKAAGAGAKGIAGAKGAIKAISGTDELGYESAEDYAKRLYGISGTKVKADETAAEYAQRITENRIQANAKYAGERVRFGKASIDQPKPDYSFLRSKVSAGEYDKMSDLERFTPISSIFAPKDVKVFEAPKETPKTGSGSSPQNPKTVFQEPITQQEVKQVSQADEIAKSLEQDTARVTQTDEAAKTASDLKQAAKTAQQSLLGEEKPAVDTIIRPISPIALRTKPSGLYGGAGLYAGYSSALGFGGLTGVERMKARQKLNLESQYLTTPQQFDSAAKQYIDQFVKPTMGQAGKSNLSTSTKATSGETLTPLSGLNTSSITTPLVVTLQTPLQSPLLTPIQTPLEDQITIPAFSVPTPSITIPGPSLITPPPPSPPTKSPPVGLVAWPLVGESSKKRRRSQFYGNYGKGLTKWKVPPLLNVNTKALDKIFGLNTPTKRKGRKK